MRHSEVAGTKTPFQGSFCSRLFFLQQKKLFSNFVENERGMSHKEALQLFGDKKIRTVWSEEEEKWYFSIIDVVAVLTNSKDSALYWRVLNNALRMRGMKSLKK